MVKKFTLIVSVLLVLLMNFFDNIAKASTNTIAKVNDEIITSYDFEERVVLFRALNNLPENYPPETKKEILDTLINDKLYLLAAKANKITIPEKDVEKKANQIIGQYPELKNHLQALKNYIRANILWVNLIQKRYAVKISINSSEMLKQKKQIKDRKYSFKQALIPAALFNGEVKEKILSINNCEQLDPLLKKFNLNHSTSITLEQHEIKEDIRDFFINAKVNKSHAFAVQGAVQVISICKIISSGYSDAEAREIIFESKLQKFAEQYLKTLKEEAIIEYYKS